MTIQYFGAHQTDVFVPALAAGAVAAVLIVLPIVLAPAVRRARRGRLVAGLCAVLAAVSLVLAGQQTAAGVAALGLQRDRVAASLRDDYGLRLAPADVRTLVDGGALKTVPGYEQRTLRLQPEGDDYVVTVDKRPLARQA